jgi:hypothetical protein
MNKWATCVCKRLLCLVRHGKTDGISDRFDFLLEEEPIIANEDVAKGPTNSDDNPAIDSELQASPSGTYKRVMEKGGEHATSATIGSKQEQDEEQDDDTLRRIKETINDIRKFEKLIDEKRRLKFPRKDERP